MRMFCSFSCIILKQKWINTKKKSIYNTENKSKTLAKAKYSENLHRLCEGKLMYFLSLLSYAAAKLGQLMNHCASVGVQMWTHCDFCLLPCERCCCWRVKSCPAEHYILLVSLLCVGITTTKRRLWVALGAWTPVNHRSTLLLGPDNRLRVFVFVCEKTVGGTMLWCCDVVINDLKYWQVVQRTSARSQRPGSV